MTHRRRVLLLFGIGRLDEMVAKGNVWYVRYYESYFDEVYVAYLLGRPREPLRQGRTTLVSLARGRAWLDAWHDSAGHRPPASPNYAWSGPPIPFRSDYAANFVHVASDTAASLQNLARSDRFVFVALWNSRGAAAKIGHVK